ncbi:MAG: MaoC/PaaZ C-terminal domain-containing protein [Actinomycetota bacterium]|jgi:acyl dehydratase|nr:MaoC/PaaZ C-terminal domain-containing protein [Actinomycetota bacterium]
MPIDPGALGAESEPTEISWTRWDCVIYALGVGCGTDELQFATHDTASAPQQVLPTFAVVAGGGERARQHDGAHPMASQASLLGKLGPVNMAMLVHGEQRVALAGPIPSDGRARLTSKIVGIYDKGSGAVVAIEGTAVDPVTDALRWQTTSSIFLRGEGGWGGDRGPSGPRNVPPEHPADHEVRYRTLPQQALLYRLSGDLNPLHADPSFAALGGFDRPILHGLCTYGFTGRALLHALCGGDPARLRSMEGRFSKPVFPGDELTVRIWVDGDECLFRTERSGGDVVIDQGRAVVA